MIEWIADLLKHDKAGDPMHGLKWTRKTTRKIAAELRRLGIRISAKTVGRLLREMGFSLRVNHKTLESGNKNPPRDECAIGSLNTSAKSGTNLPPGRAPSSASTRRRRSWSGNSKIRACRGSKSHNW